MAINRIQSLALPKRAPSSSVAVSVPQIPQGFVMCPPQLVAINAWQQEIYRLAYQQAKAAAEIPRYHRQLFSVWN